MRSMRAGPERCIMVQSVGLRTEVCSLRKCLWLLKLGNTGRPSALGHDPEKLQTFRIRSCVKDKGLGHDPEKLQTFRIRSCVKDKGLERNRDSTLSDFALARICA